MILTFILIWSPLIEIYFGTGSIYFNIFFRSLEFSIGVLLGSMKEDIEKWKYCRFLCHPCAIMLEFAVLILGATLAVKIGIPANYMLYSWIALPCFIVIISSFAQCSNINSRIKSLTVCCKIAYAFFFAQFFSWPISKMMISKGMLNNNWQKVLFSFSINLFIAILMRSVVERPIQQYLKYKLQGKGN